MAARTERIKILLEIRSVGQLNPTLVAQPRAVGMVLIAIAGLVAEPAHIMVGLRGGYKLV